MLSTAIAHRAAEAAYVAQQLSFALPSAALQRVLRTASGQSVAPDRETAAELERAFRRLLETDISNVRAGLYPRSLLFQVPVREYARRSPEFFLDIPRVARRRWRAGWRELPIEADPRAYPSYFRRTFHWQTDGYLSRHSARIYDVSVEFLFGGTADVMRRQVVPPITRFAQERGADEGKGLRALDVACGTGRTLAQLHAALPKLRLTGVDLSPFYAHEARTLLRHLPEVCIAAENGEELPFRDGWFDVITSTYLFHELPRNARRNVLREMYRALAPGGLLVLEDSAQPGDQQSHDPVGFFLQRFPEDFHEPFYRDYLSDKLQDAAREVGFEVESVKRHFVAKVVVARKPL